MSVELEGRANALRKEALQCLTVALCGSDTKKFWELLTTYFRANHTGDEDDPWDFIDPAPEIPRPLPLTETDTDEENKAPSASAEASAPVPPFCSPGHAARGGLIKCKRRPAQEVESSSNSSSEDSFPDSTSSSCDSEGSNTSLQSTKQDPAVEGSGYTPPQHEAIKEGAVALKGQATLEALQQHKSALKQPTTAIVATRDLTNQPPLAQELAVGLVVGDLPPLGEAMEDPLDDMPELETTPPRPFPKKPKLDKE